MGKGSKKRNFGPQVGEPEKVLCGDLKSFFRMQNLVKASTSLNSAHQEQLIARYVYQLYLEVVY